MSTFSLKFLKPVLNSNLFDDKANLNLTPVFFLHLLFLLFFAVFTLLADTIHSYGSHPDISNITPWICRSLNEVDGIELHIMTLAFPAYLTIGYLMIEKINFKLKYTSEPIIPLLYFAVVLSIFIQHFLLGDRDLNRDNLLIVSFITLAICISLIKLSVFSWPDGIRLFLPFIYLFLLTILGLLINANASIFDYSYFIGPANKILNGELPNSFYMQYNVAGTFLFVLMQKFNLKLHEMQFVFTLIFSAWILLYRTTAIHLFQHKIYISLFLFALIIIRCFAISEGPVSIPQVSPLRLDLWVPLLIVVSEFWF